MLLSWRFNFPRTKIYICSRATIYLLPHKTLNLISSSPKLSCQCSQQIFQRNKSRDNKLFFKWMSLASCSHICKASQERIKNSHQHFMKKDTATFGWQILAHEGKIEMFLKGLELLLLALEDNDWHWSLRWVTEVGTPKSRSTQSQEI